ncbi:hypothetical protein QW131_08100 [Roseibium salinum]|nr:hypothetical protein [Roseibium salinum]
MADALIARARDGIRVYFLYDDVGSHSLPKAFLLRLKEAGVKVCGFNEKNTGFSVFSAPCGSITATIASWS